MSEPDEETKHAKIIVRVIDPSYPPVRVVLRVIFVSLSVVAALWVLYKLTAILLLLILSVFFAYLVYPLVEFLHRPRQVGNLRIAIPRVLAIGLSYLLIFAAVFFCFYFIVPQLASQFPQFAQQAQNYGKAISTKTQQLNEYFKQHQMPASITNAINDEVPIILERVGSTASILITSLAGWAVFIPWVVLIPILSFFMLKDGESFRRSALQMLPRGRWRWRGDEFFQDVNSALAAYTRAQLTACFFIGAVCAGGFAVIGLPSPLVLGLIAGLFEFVPLAGPLIMAILAALAAILYSGFAAALVVLIFLGVLRIVQDYIIYPRLIRHGVHLHPLAVIVAILSGAELGGVAGVLLAIPIVAIVTVSYRHWLEHRGSEGFADLLVDSPSTGAAQAGPSAAEDRNSVTAAVSAKSSATNLTADTTAEEMARARPDLTTGELKLPVED